MTMELSVKSRMEMLDQQIASCKSMLHDLPDGVLHVGRNGKYYNWKWVDAEGTGTTFQKMTRTRRCSGH